MSKMEMLTVHGQEGVMPLVTSHSIDGTFNHCERKFEFAHSYQQVPESGSVGMAAEVGTAMHEAIQAWAAIWLHPASTRTDDERNSAVAAAVFALIKWWPFTVEAIALKAKKLASKQRSLVRSMQLLMSVIEHRFWDDYELAVLPDGSPAIEIPWRVIHKSLGVFNDSIGRPRVLVTQGKIDFVLRHRVTKTIEVIDLKTTNKADEMLDSAFRFSGQALQYTLIVGAALNWDWSKTGIKVTYLVASYIDFSIKPKPYHIGPSEINDFLLTRKDMLNKMVSNSKRQWWPRKLHGCDSYMTACPYMDICHRRDADFISAWFEDDHQPFIERPRIYEAMWNFED